MAVSYKRLWKLLIDKDMKKKDLAAAAGISTYTISKMGKGENITTEVLGKICGALNCSIEDIMEFIPDEPNPLVSQAEVTITDLRIRLEPSTSSRIMGYAPVGYYDVMETVSEEDYVWFKVCNYWIAFVDGVIYHGSQEDPKDKEIAELKQKVAELEEQVASLENEVETQARVIKQQIEDFDSIRVIAARNIPE